MSALKVLNYTTNVNLKHTGKLQCLFYILSLNSKAVTFGFSKWFTVLNN